MSNRFYLSGQDRAKGVHDLFELVAARYDVLNDLLSLGLHRRWKRRLVRLAGVQEGQRALDLCCGTGDVSMDLARRGALVAGLDFSEPMLRIAFNRSRKADAGCQEPPRGILFVHGDAQRTPFPDNSFAAVTVAYGLRNLESWERGLEEMLRVVKPGGRVLVLDFGKPDNRLWRAIYFTHLRIVAPVAGRVFCGSAAAYGYIIESLRHYPAQHGVARKMREMGMGDVQIIPLLWGAMTINYGEKPHP